MSTLPSILDRSTARKGTETDSGRPDGAESGGGLLRSAIIGLVAGVLLYAAVSRLRNVTSRAVGGAEGGPPASVEGIRDRVEALTPETPSSIPIGVPGGGGGEAEPAPPRAPEAEPGELEEPDEPEPVRSEAGPGEGGRTGADRAGGRSPSEAADSVREEERSPAELDELATDEIQEEPAEPGELSVDEEIIEDVADEGDAGEEATDEEGSAIEREGRTADEEETEE